MFDIGFWELLLIFSIALIVLGPERLPKAARTVGHWTGRARAFVRNLTTELERETRKSEAARSFAEAKRVMQQSVTDLDKQADDDGSTSTSSQEKASKQAASGE
ncbi:Sec-independent protein translocase protein TatB [uncultured Abyssibacter sp.]|uniref:Sec-independent protein translocase protein TatB n=1 Tax=uncultured Abyssibacter sp. TaxID=2320202 RepID=UPI0032B18BAA